MISTSMQGRKRGLAAAPASTLPQVRTHAFQVFRSIDPWHRCCIGNRDGDDVAMPERAQLLQRLEALERGRRELGLDVEKGATIRVQTDMPICRQARWKLLGRVAPGIARIRDARPAEVQGVSAAVEHDFHHVRIAQFLGVHDSAAKCGDRGSGIGFQG